MTYYKLENGNLKKVGSVIKTSRGWVSNPTTEDYAAIGAYPRNDASLITPKVDEGFKAVADGYELIDGKWNRKWKTEPIVYTPDDYDRAMEDYIRQMRIDRGYTLREPSEYKGDPYPRFAQDAEDFILFRSLCMQYVLPILNKYKETGEAPTMEEFKAGFPKCEWTYQEEM